MEEESISIESSDVGLKRKSSVEDILRNKRKGMREKMMIVEMGLNKMRVKKRES